MKYNDTIISKDIKYIGVDDKEIDIFEGQYVVPNGISYNSYLIKDEKNVVMDTIDSRKTDEWLDNLENALKIETQDVEYKKGIELVLKQFKDILKSKGVEEIPAMGETFDPSLHEAVGSVQDAEKNSQEIVVTTAISSKFNLRRVAPP